MTFEDGIRTTVDWYMNNRDWWQPILVGTYQGQRLGLISGGD
jgi:dTDP-glucose 4,6-dehydratase